MKKSIRWIALLLVALCAAGCLTGCSQPAENTGSKGGAKGVPAGDYYLDLTDLGMKLTVYLRIDGEGAFTFSDTLSFESVKSGGTCQATESGCLMVFTSVNGEERSISEGLTSGFAVMEDGALDFGGNGTIPYGSAGISTVSDTDPELRLIARPVTEDFIAPSLESSFRTGMYVCESITEAGVEYHHAASFFEDNTYMLTTRWTQDGKLCFACETGSYGVSTSTLALEPQTDGAAERLQCEIMDDASLQLSVFAFPGAAERAAVTFTQKETADSVALLTGKGSIGGSVVTFDVTFEIFGDGSYIAVADGHEERGMIALDTAAATAKQYPDHPATGARGLSQVATVPYAVCGYAEEGGLTLTDLRVCTSENLTRFKATVAE